MDELLLVRAGLEHLLESVLSSSSESDCGFRPRSDPAWGSAPYRSIFGSQFLTWRGIPFVPTDKLAIASEGDQTSILLLAQLSYGSGIAISSRSSLRSDL
jgi:Phage capsid-like protein